MKNTSNQLCPECQDAENEQNIDIKCILDKLESETKCQLSDRDISYLCLCLTLCSRYEVAFRFYKYKRPTIEQLKNKDSGITKKAKNLSSEMSDKVHFYIKQFMGIDEDKKRIPRWTDVISFFKSEGCVSNDLSDKPLVLFAMNTGEITKEEMINRLKNIGFSNIKMIDWESEK